jgi:hypothetical protein
MKRHESHNAVVDLEGILIKGYIMSSWMKNYECPE